MTGIERLELTGCEGNALAGDLRRAEKPRGVVVLAHGGGQTRHSWGGTAEALARGGVSAVTFDQRGHGDSAWVSSEDYSFERFGDDMLQVVKAVKALTGFEPGVVGASLGGLAGIYAGGKAGDAAGMAALVLVDITPKMRVDGVERIVGFMQQHSEEGFGSVEEAADVISEYLPHRPRPTNLSGLSKNLRQSEDGRYRWHWDPKFITTRADAAKHAAIAEKAGFELASKLKMPVLLVRGRESELVGDDEVRAFTKAVPHAKFEDIAGARHMVAGDENDAFTDALLTFFGSLTWR